MHNEQGTPVSPQRIKLTFDATLILVEDDMEVM
jgi:hypothetical protein